MYLAGRDATPFATIERSFEKIRRRTKVIP
jgi:hypothetical protein